MWRCSAMRLWAMLWKRVGNTPRHPSGQRWGGTGLGPGRRPGGGGCNSGGRGQHLPPPHGRRHLCLFLSTGGVGRLRVSRGGSGEWGKRRVAARRREVPVFGAGAWGSRIKMREQMSKKGASSVVWVPLLALELGSWEVEREERFCLCG